MITHFPPSSCRQSRSSVSRRVSIPRQVEPPGVAEEPRRHRIVPDCPDCPEDCQNRLASRPLSRGRTNQQSHLTRRCAKKKQHTHARIETMYPRSHTSKRWCCKGLLAALNNGVRPRLSLDLVDAPAVSRTSITGSWPATAANARAVSPSPPGLTLSTSSPFCRHLVQEDATGLGHDQTAAVREPGLHAQCGLSGA